jgi:hypothetical protein
MQAVKERGREEEKVERESVVMSNTGRVRTPSTSVQDGGSEKGVLMMMGKKRTGSVITSSSASSKVSGLSMKSR